MPWRELPHTADLRLEIQAPDWPALLAEATRALAAQLGASAEDAPAETRTLQISAIDREELLVRWLTEVLVWHELEGVVPTKVEVRRAGESEAEGAITVAPAVERSEHVKAVTYHQLAVEETRDGLVVRVVFDT